MKPQLPLISAKVTLLPELTRGRGLIGRQYRPHIVLGPTDQRRPVVAEGNVLTESYLGVAFWSGPETLEPGEEATVEFVLAYWTDAPAAYAGVIAEATFTVREGGTIVGYGRVESRVDP